MARARGTYNVIFVGTNHVVLEHMLFMSGLKVVRAYFPRGGRSTPYLVTLCKIHDVPFVAAKNSRQIGDDLVKLQKPDLGVCCYFDMLGSGVFSYPKKGFVNVHPSVLPAYKGRTPWYYMLVNNEKHTGVTIHQMTTKVDSGVIYCSERWPILMSDDYASIGNKTNAAICRLLDRHLLDILNGRAKGKANTNCGAMPGIRDAQTIDVTDEPVRILNTIRSQRTYGGCRVVGKRGSFSIVSALIDIGGGKQARLGTVLRSEKDYFTIALREGLALRVLGWSPRARRPGVGEVIAAGKKGGKDE